ncbi:MAG: TolC family protein [Lacunisphaera sp.]|nr:TolC family protein [Lacunisphaera sp.]
MSARRIFAIAATLAALLFAGCTGPSSAERSARDQVEQIGDQLKSTAIKPALPSLRTDSPLADFARYAVLNHPAVFGAYQDWRASMEAIAPARALPDPKLTFEADIADTLMTFMPGLMFDFMTPGKRAAMGREATAASQVAYRVYVSTVLRTAADVRKGWIDLAYQDEVIRLREASLTTFDQALAVAQVDYTTGRGMSTLENQIRLASEVTRLRSDLANLQDRRTAIRQAFKSTLGLAASDPDPAWPQIALTSTVLPPDEELWRRTQESNPGLAQMRAMVEMALAGVAVARKAGTPDFSLGLMADLKADPLMLRPTATVTLPIWRGKIAAAIASAEARRDAASARVSAEQLNLAAELAQMLFMVRESDRMIAYIDQTALPNYDRTIASVEAGYQSGMTGLAMIPETRLMAIGMQAERAAALRDRENAVTGLLLMIAAAPAGSPLLAESPAV